MTDNLLLDMTNVYVLNILQQPMYQWRIKVGNHNKTTIIIYNYFEFGKC